MKRLMTAGLATLAVFAGGAAVTTATADATVVSRCTGSRIDTVNINNRVGELIGRVDLFYSSNGHNCAMTTSYLGRPVTMVARLAVQGGPTEVVTGRWTYYSDGVDLPAAGKCVTFGGTINGGTVDQGSASKGPGHCS